jgi:hypothetical protein
MLAAYQGLPRLMKCPKRKAVGYEAAVLASMIVIGFGTSLTLLALVGGLIGS